MASKPMIRKKAQLYKQRYSIEYHFTYHTGKTFKKLHALNPWFIYINAYLDNVSTLQNVKQHR